MYKYEQALLQQGIKYIAGTDEVGRGPLAGPVVCASVILPQGYQNDLIIDSKKIKSEKKREAIFSEIIKDALAYKIIFIDINTIDKINIKNASKLGMKQAVEGLTIKPQHVLVDYETLDLSIPQTSITKGDNQSISIAAASILAKVSRDRYMNKLHKDFPKYNWITNKGYGTKEHLKAIQQIGFTIHHRKSFNPVKRMIQENN